MSYLEINGTRLEYEWLETTPGLPAAAAAAPASPTLVFLHEGLGSTALWKDFPARAVAATGCPALVYSRYGYGKSESLHEPRGVDYMHREALQTLPAVLEALSVDNPFLIGHSDGASIALIYTGARRGPVRGLVLMAPHVFVEDITCNSIAQAKITFETTELPVRLGRYHDDVQSAFWGWNDIWLHPDFRAWNIEAFLQGVEVPALLIQGEDDQYGTRAQVDAVARQVSGPVTTLMLSDCGHSPHVDQKETTLGAIAEFVTRPAAG